MIVPLSNPIVSDIRIPVPLQTDYVGVYLTNRCFLKCPYCVTNINEPFINRPGGVELDPFSWIQGLNRFHLPEGVPITLQGGEPFLYPGIWELLENIRHKVDILTALPSHVTVERFKALESLAWNHRVAPYPTIRVSFHRGQNDFRVLIRRIKELQEECGLSIGLYHISHPAYPELIEAVRAEARAEGVEFRTKIFLGEHDGKMYGEYKYPDACLGKGVSRDKVWCRNTVFPIGPDGNIYKCHADLYAGRSHLALGNIRDETLRLEQKYRPCSFYGLCSPCDIKVKTNHLQQFGYTSVDIRFDEKA